MILIHPKYDIVNINASLECLEEIGRICYQSAPKGDTSDKFIQRIIERGHLSVIEHSLITINFIIDRGLSHELVRHRLASFTQESTRYCNYNTGVTFIIPPWSDIEEGEYLSEYYVKYPEVSSAKAVWFRSCLHNENDYLNLLRCGCKPEQARSVLNNSLKTQIIVSANLREWRHILKLRTSLGAHEQMRSIMSDVLQDLKNQVPVIFDDIEASNVEAHLPSKTL